MLNNFQSQLLKRNFSSNFKKVKHATSFWNIDIRKDKYNNNIYFKLNDISNILNLKKKNITDIHIPKEDYVKIDIEHGESIFITHIGLMRMLMNYKKNNQDYHKLKNMAFDIIFKLKL